MERRRWKTANCFSLKKKNKLNQLSIMIYNFQDTNYWILMKIMRPMIFFLITYLLNSCD